MISSSLSIKILGVAVAGFLTIGVPVIVGIKKEAARQEKETVLQGLFPGKSIEEAFKGETFSEQLFEDWNPDEQQQKYISANWQKIIPKMPIKFFEKHESKSMKPNFQTPNTCYLKIFYSKKSLNIAAGDASPLDAPIIYIPFPQGKVTYTGSTLSSTDKGFESSTQSDDNSPLVPNSEKPAWNYASKQSNSTKTFSHNSKGQKQDTTTYKEILFLQDLYVVTSKRLDELNFHKWDKNNFWTYDSGDCSAYASTSKASK